MKLIELKNVTKQYGSGHTLVEALHPTNFELNKGEFVGIIGPSGSGKTTFLTILGNLQSPTSGEILVNGKDTSKITEKERTDLRFEEFGFILQASNLIPFLTIEDQLNLIDRFSITEKQKLDRNDLINFLDLKGTLKNYPNNLSGGERQRAAIARALYNNPSIILADEPTASLDTNRAKQVVALLSKIAHEYNRGVVMITHDTRMLDSVDKIYEMQDGVLKPLPKKSAQ